ncbi:MAG: hypothetical protein ABFS37_09840 [Acidobacteriota bacterium]
MAGIVVLDVGLGQMVDLIGPERGVNGPEDVNFGPDGSMYWAQMFTGEIARMAPDGTVTTQMIGRGGEKWRPGHGSDHRQHTGWNGRT